MSAPSSRTLCTLAGLALVIGLAGCSREPAEAIIQPNGEAWPAVIHYAYTPSSEDPEGRLLQAQALADYLTRETGVTVKITKAMSYAPVIEAMRTGKIDVASGGSFSYMIAHEKAGAEALLVRGTTDGANTTYTSIIATSPKTGITTIDQLLTHPERYVFAFTDAASTSGHLVPRSYIESRGVNPEKAFREVVFTQSHLNAMMTAIAAKVDAAALSKSNYTSFVKSGRIKPEELVILWESAPIPNGPIFVRGTLPAGLKARIQDAYLHMPERDPALMQSMREQADVADLVWVAADDSLWDPLREIAYSLETMQLLEKR